VADNIDVSAAVVRTYNVTFNSADLGWIEDPEIEAVPDLEPVHVSQYGRQVMGHRVLGIDVKIKAKLMEVTKANLAQAFPWYSGAGDVPLAPVALGGDLYDLAHELVLHPRDMGSDLSQDLHLTKAASAGGLKLKGDGEKEHEIQIEWRAYPDRAELPDVVLGYIGD
jgi:hypothetical protein